MAYVGEVGIFGGSFNPVHRGHIAIADYVAQTCGLDTVLMMLSPLNPLKAAAELMSDTDRMAMLRLACDGHPRLTPCDVELTLPRPSYTVDTLRYLSAANPDARFRVIIGGDNWDAFSRWREHDTILRDYGVIIYPRPGQHLDVPADNPAVTLVAGTPPLYDISSTEVRRRVAAGEDITDLVIPSVARYMSDNRCLASISGIK